MPASSSASSSTLGVIVPVRGSAGWAFAHKIVTWIRHLNVLHASRGPPDRVRDTRGADEIPAERPCPTPDRGGAAGPGDDAFSPWFPRRARARSSEAQSD